MLREAIVAPLVLVMGVHAATVQVPTDQPTIQAGIDAAAEGDTVLVAPGTYTGEDNRKLDFGGIDRVLVSEQGAFVTVIDCELSGRGFWFGSGETAASVVDGFTVRNGRDLSHDPSGGGIYCFRSSPTLQNCMISDNSASSRGGGGVYCYSSSATLANCTISGNRGLGNDGSGGGIRCVNSAPTLSDCTISENSAGAHGGGISCSGSSPKLINCTISRNSASWEGAGFFCRDLSSPTLVNCTIAGNSAGWAGGGICWADSSSSMLTNCTIAGNSAVGRGGGVYCVGEEPSPTLTNCILWGDTPSEIDGGDPTLTHCDVQGGHEGEGNIDADPQFVGPLGGDFHLTPGSLCIDTGSSVGALERDFEGDVRPAGDGFDIGADEYSPVGMGAPSSGPPARRAALAEARPNPFNPRTTIPFELTEAQGVRLAVYDLRGALVRILIDGPRAAGLHTEDWDGTNSVGLSMPSAAYIVRLMAGETIEQRRLLLLK